MSFQRDQLKEFTEEEKARFAKERRIMEMRDLYSSYSSGRVSMAWLLILVLYELKDLVKSLAQILTPNDSSGGR